MRRFDLETPMARKVQRKNRNETDWKQTQTSNTQLMSVHHPETAEFVSEKVQLAWSASWWSSSQIRRDFSLDASVVFLPETQSNGYSRYQVNTQRKAWRDDVSLQFQLHRADALWNDQRATLLLSSLRLIVLPCLAFCKETKQNQPSALKRFWKKSYLTALAANPWLGSSGSNTQIEG